MIEKGQAAFDKEMAKLRVLLRRGDVKQEEVDSREKLLRLYHGLPPLAPEPGSIRIIDPSRPETMPNAPEQSNAELMVGGILLVVAFVLFGFLVKSCMGPSKSDAQIAEEHRNGVHCLSSWDGSDSALVAKVKEQLRDPSSFEHVRTSITAVDDNGLHTVLMEYRARNGFGGLNDEYASGHIRNSDCSLVDWSAQ